MIVCPFCGYENIDGVDTCEQCEEALTEEYLHEPITRVEKALLDDHIVALEPKSPITVPPDRSVGDVIRLMVEKKIGCVVVTSEDAIVGIFTERDALFKLNEDASALSEQPVSEFMKPYVETLDEGAKIAYALERMDLGGYRHIPIVDAEGKTTGIISARDILMYLTERLELPDS